MRRQVYIDTSILGALADAGPEERTRSTGHLLQLVKDGVVEGYISAVVLEELDRASDDIRKLIENTIKGSGLLVLEESEESVSLSGLCVEAGAIPERYGDDARHLAVASVNAISVVVSWNFRHMVNVETKRRVNAVNMREGYPQLDIVSPLEVEYGED